MELIRDGILLRPEKTGEVTVDDCIGLLPNKVGPLSIEEMNARLAGRFRMQGR